ncbi:unnamed protein product [Closterium sp. Yama58-4]|nr:unnamed protein product [Closterium sp. Yama58-4]
MPASPRSRRPRPPDPVARGPAIPSPAAPRSRRPRPRDPVARGPAIPSPAAPRSRRPRPCHPVARGPAIPSPAAPRSRRPRPRDPVARGPRFPVAPPWGAARGPSLPRGGVLGAARRPPRRPPCSFPRSARYFGPRSLLLLYSGALIPGSHVVAPEPSVARVSAASVVASYLLSSRQPSSSSLAPCDCL